MPKFRDIAPYTKTPSYMADVPLTHIERTIRDYIENDGLEINSDFQRGHVWDEEKQIAFVEHILRGGRGSHQIRFNSPGWMRTWEGPMVLVDGLQRLTAIRRFLKDEIPVFKHYYSEYEDRLDNTLSLNFMINDLPTKADVLRWYIEINEGGVVHAEDEITRVKDMLAQETTSLD